MSEQCSPELVQRHSQLLGNIESELRGLRSDTDRHEGIYKAVMQLSVTSERTLIVLEQQAKVQEVQAKVQDKILTDIDFLKEHAETKSTVERIHERVDILENKDALEALDFQKKFKGWLFYGFGSIIITIIGAVVLIALNLS